MNRRASDTVQNVVHFTMISCQHFKVSIGHINEHTGKNSIFLPDELLNHLGDGWLSEKNPFPFYRCLSVTSQVIKNIVRRREGAGEGRNCALTERTFRIDLLLIIIYSVAV